MKLWVKLGLFLSSYLPLFLIFAIKNWYNLALVIVLIFVIIYNLVWFVIYWLANKTTIESYKVLRADNKTRDVLSYLIPYIVSFIGLDLTKWQDITSLIILLAILFVVSLDSDLNYINPILYFLNYRIYDVEVRKPYQYCENDIGRIVLITKKKIKRDQTICVRDLDGNVMLEVLK